MHTNEHENASVIPHPVDQMECEHTFTNKRLLGPVAPISVNFNHQLAYFADHSDTTHVRHHQRQ